MDYLEEILIRYPDETSIDLSNRYLYILFRKIETLKPFIPLLTKFANLKELDISYNNLFSLPPNLTSLQSIESINIMNNDFNDLMNIVEVLETLPNLKSLEISLSRKEEVTFVLYNLPNLKFLNRESI